MCVVPSPDGYDQLTIAVDRVIGGITRRFMETLSAPFEDDAKEDAYFVDCGSTYVGTPISTISGLTWLEGETVHILADGKVISPRVVTGGSITLPYAASKVHIGLPIENHVRTLRAPIQTKDGSALGRRTRVVSVIVDAYKSLGILVKGKRGGFERLYERSMAVPMGQSPPLVTGTAQVALDSGWDRDGEIEFTVDGPLPATIRALNINLETEP
jgi:hypothetical protein